MEKEKRAAIFEKGFYIRELSTFALSD